MPADDPRAISPAAAPFRPQRIVPFALLDASAALGCAALLPVLVRRLRARRVAATTPG